MSFLADYEPVEDRIRKFWDDHPKGRITTSVLPSADGHYVVNAAVYREGEDVPAATGHAEETVGSSPVNKLSALENCETSAIGRALANLGYAPKGKRPSREEMDKSQRSVEERPPDPVNANGCPSCGATVENLGDPGGTKNPRWRCTNRSCQGGGKKRDGGNWPWASWDEDPWSPKPTRQDFPPSDLVPPAEFFPPGEEPF